MTSRDYPFEALSDVWTGTVRLEKKFNKKAQRHELVDAVDDSRLITTGLLGSIRWWFEVVARGLGGAPCDPSDTQCMDGKHCVVCELFGCTGWARKFRFDVLDAAGVPKQVQIKAGDTFTLRFTPLRAVRDEEWTLLDLTLHLIAEHAALGGKTPFKPTDEGHRRGQLHHQDFGLVRLTSTAPPVPQTSSSKLSAYVGDDQWRTAPQNGMAWASLANFWSVPGRYLARQDADNSTFNRVIGRGEPKTNGGTGDSWLAGRRAGGGQPGASKKLFSFRDPGRTYGFVNPTGNGQDRVTLNTIKQRLEQAWGNDVAVDPEAEATGGIPLRTGPKILDSLLSRGAT